MNNKTLCLSCKTSQQAVDNCWLSHYSKLNVQKWEIWNFHLVNISSKHTQVGVFASLMLFASLHLNDDDENMLIPCAEWAYLADLFLIRFLDNFRSHSERIIARKIRNVACSPKGTYEALNMWGLLVNGPRNLCSTPITALKVSQFPRAFKLSELSLERHSGTNLFSHYDWRDVSSTNFVWIDNITFVVVRKWQSSPGNDSSEKKKSCRAIWVIKI